MSAPLPRLGRHPVTPTAAGEIYPLPLLTAPAPLPARLPAALPILAALMAGILWAAANPWWALPAALAASLALLAGLSASGWRRLLLPLVCLLAGGAGVLRERSALNVPDPLSRYVGGQLTLTGRWDGQFLHLADPPAAVALAPRPAARPGLVSARGVLVRPQGRRIPGGFDQAAWLRLQGVSAVLAGAQLRSSTPEGGLRGWFRRGLTTGLPPREAALMQAIELGDRSALRGEPLEGGVAVQDAFARAGLAHLMALSGQNVALLLTLVGLLFVRIPRLGAALTPLRIGPLHLGDGRYPLLLLFLVGYLWLVGPTPSVTRAVLMAAAGLLALWAGRGRPDPLGVLALSAVAGLLWQPGWLLDAGFQLSYLAVLGLLLSPRAARLLPARWPEWLRLALVATLLAEAATLPVVAGDFGQLPLVSLPANLLAEGLMGLLVPLGFVAGLLGPLALPLNWVVLVLARLLLTLAGFLGSVQPLPWGTVSPVGYAAYAVFAAAGVLALLGKVRLPLFLAVAALCALGTTLPARLVPPREVVYLDVGQGDSTLLRAGGLRVLIDGGGTPRSDYDVGAGTVFPALRAMGVRGLDVVVATHADADHIEGLASVLRLVPVGELWIGQRKQGDPVLDAVLAAARERHVPVREVRRGDTVRAGEFTLQVLWPTGAGWAKADNENSVVVRLSSPHFRTAVLGDLPDPLEGRLGLGPLDLLKTAHHGSRYSSGADFLAATRPHDAVISVGRNSYGHPSPEVLERLRAAGVRVWRTDELGTIRWPIP